MAMKLTQRQQDMLDGKLGENAEKALRAFAEAKGLPSDKPLTEEVWSKLVQASPDPAIPKALCALTSRKLRQTSSD
jgi:hypothetical protein